MGTLLTLVWRGLQMILWILLLGFLALIALSRFTPFEALVVRSGSMAPASQRVESSLSIARRAHRRSEWSPRSASPTARS